MKRPKPGCREDDVARANRGCLNGFFLGARVRRSNNKLLPQSNDQQQSETGSIHLFVSAFR